MFVYSDIDDLPRHVQSQLFEEILDGDVDKGRKLLDQQDIIESVVTLFKHSCSLHLMDTSVKTNFV